MIVAALVFFYVISAFAGRWLASNSGNFTSEHYTFKKYLPFFLGYVCTFTVLVDTSAVVDIKTNPFGTLFAYFVFFLTSSFLHKFIMFSAKQITLYCNDLTNDSTDNFILWIFRRRKRIKTYYEFYDKKEIGLDSGMVGLFAFGFLAYTIGIIIVVSYELF